MSYLDTPHKKKSAVLTTIIMGLILFLIFTFGMTYFDPPKEYGIAVNFGTSDIGSGDVQPTEPLKSAAEETENEEEIIEAISKLKGLKVIAADSIGNSKNLYTDAVKKISGNGYEELMEVKDAQEDMKFMIKEKDGIIDELVMVVGGNKSFFILSLYGEIDLKKISKLSKSMNIKGIEHLQQLDDSDEKKKN